MEVFLHFIVSICRDYPEILIFFALAGGYFIGKIKFFGFNLGSTASVLIVALIVGQIGVHIAPLLQTIAFALFIYTIGYKVGPEFFGSLKKEGLKFISLSLVVSIVALITAYFLGRLFKFDIGTTAGLLGGAMTQSTVIGTATGAIKNLAISASQKATFQSNIAIAYAITYIFGTAGLVIFFKLVPRLFRMNLKSEAKKLESQMSQSLSETADSMVFDWQEQLNARAYQVIQKNLSGKTVSEIEDMFLEKVVIDKVKRDEKMFEAHSNTQIYVGDIIAFIGSQTALFKANKIIGKEVNDPEMIHILGKTLPICILNKKLVGKSLEYINQKYGHGCFLKKITRQGHNIPITKNTLIKKCDVMHIVGEQKRVEQLAKWAGYAERPTIKTDLVMVSLGCALGTLLGLLVVPVFGIPVTLGVGGGVLVAGLIFGWLRSIHPTFGQLPESAQWIFTDLGLNLFVVCIGLTAGPKALSALQHAGLSIFFAGIIMTLIPTLVGLFFGKYFLKLNPVLLLGALAGSGTITAALNAIKEEADSDMPALGYTVPYAFGNVLLTIWGTVIIHLLH